MKIFVSTLIIASAACAVAAQEAVRATAPSPEVKSRLVAELAAAAKGGSIKNSPFTAEETNESVQTLADGNRIVRSSTGKFYRNSEGRIRRETSGGIGGVAGTTYSFGQGVSIVSPDLGHKYLLDSTMQTAKVIELAQGQNQNLFTTAQRAYTIAGAGALSEADRTNALEKLKEEVRVSSKDSQILRMSQGTVALSPIAPLTGLAAVKATAPVEAFSYNGFGGPVTMYNSKYESRTEELGTRDFSGVSADGTRRITTIPAGAIGNDRPIEMVYERWFSKDLGVVVHSKNTDPRSGEQTYTMTNIVRAEPDPSLFSVPTHYRKVSENGNVYRTSAASGVTKKPVPVAKTINVSNPSGKSIQQ